MRVSVIIPVFRDDIALGQLLQKLETMDVKEVIISDGEQRADMPEPLKPKLLTFKYVNSKQGRGPQILAGLQAARSSFVWVLHADSIPPHDGPKAIKKTLENTETSLLTFTLGFDKPSWLLHVFSWLARWDSPVSTFGDQGFAFRKCDFESLDLDLNHYPLMEDVALRKGLKKRGIIRRSPLTIVTSSRRFQKFGALKTQWLNLTILIRYFFGASPTTLYNTYYLISAAQE